jgi:hypothetical protein
MTSKPLEDAIKNGGEISKLSCTCPVTNKKLTREEEIKEELRKRKEEIGY